MRGVHNEIINLTNAYMGSSPHARGPRTVQRNAYGPGGIIPACAGSTQIQGGDSAWG